ncbi:MAG: ATP-binding cassette domain-containing protein [Vicinamibacterales bacterium]
METVDVRCDRVSKRYRVRTPRRTTGAGVAGGWFSGFRTREDDFWALRDVSFEIARGETLGVIGRNGAGKSTLLKLLGGITSPTSGEITIVGKLSAMIEVGSGFHPELTGRENVFLSGAILGMRRRDIAARLDAIADFSGVAAFLDMPVKHYSSGMYVRLGFAIAAHLEPDILLVDEVLAVGDAEFQGRCIDRIQSLKRRGTTMLLVSHDLGAVEQLSDRAILFDGGRVTAAGSPHDVVSTYQRLVSGPDSAGVTDAEEGDTSGPAVRVTRLTLQDVSGTAVLTATAGAPLAARVGLEFTAPVTAIVTVSFYAFDSGTLLTECRGEVESPGPDHPNGGVELLFTLDALLLAAGAYTLGVTATVRGADRPIAWRFGRTTLYVQGRSQERGVFAQPFEYRVARPEPVRAGTSLQP